MRLVLAVLVASSGCAQLFGIDETSGADANTDFATLEVQRVSVGASIIKTPQPMDMQTAQFLQDDGAGGLARVPGELVPPNRFSVDLPGTPPVIYTLPDANVPTRMAALPSRTQRVNYGVFEHPNPQEPFMSSQVMVGVTLPSPYVSGESFQIHAVGAWMVRSLIAAELPLPDMTLSTISTTLDYSSFNSSFGAAGPRYRITSADIVLLLRYVGVRLTGVFQAQFDQIDGINMMSGMMTAVGMGDMVMGNITPTEYATRYAAVRPAVTGLGMLWRVTAAPGWSLGSDTGIRLNQASPAMTDTAIMLPYSNPFESLDWRALVTFSTSSSRTYALTEGAATVNVGLAARLETVSLPGTAAITFNMPAGLPNTVRANQTLLTTDGMTLVIDRAKALEVDAIIDRPTNTMYELSVVELGIDMTGTNPQLTRKVILYAHTTGMPAFKLPPDIFTVGKQYYIAFRCYQGGFTEAANGDTQTVTLPYSIGSLDSAVFTVGMP